MIEAYKIGASLNMTSDVPKIMAQIAEEFESFDRLIKGAQNNIRNYVRELATLTSGAKGVDALIRSLSKLSSLNLAPNVLSGMEKVATVTGRIAGEQQTIARSASETAAAWRATAEAMAGARAPGGRGPAGPPPPGGPPARPGRGGGEEGGRMAAAVGSDAMMAGIGLSMAGTGVLTFAKKSFEAAAEIGAQQARLTMMGYTDPQVQQALALGRKLQQDVPGTTIAKNLETLADVTSVFQKPGEAMAIMPDLARMGIVLGAAGKGDQIKELFAAARAGELRGSLSNPETNEIDTDKFGKFLKALTAVTVMTGGRIGPQDYTMFLQQAGIGGVRLSDEALFGEMPAIMMAMKSVKAGTALSSFNQTEFGRLFKPYGREQERIGLIAPGGFSMGKGSSGGAGTIAPGALADHDLAQTDPALWAYRTLVPAMEKAGFKDMNSQLTELYRLFPRATITRLFEDIIRNRALIENYQRAIDTGMKPGSAASQAYETQQAVNPQIRVAAFEASMTGFFSALGEAAMGPATQMLKDLTAGLNKLATWAKENPTLAKYTLEVATGLGVLSVAVGGLFTTLFFAVATVKAVKGLLLGGGGAAAAGAASAGAEAVAASAGATALAGPRVLSKLPLLSMAGYVAGLYELAKLGSDTETPENRKAIDDLNRQRRSLEGGPQGAVNDGFDAMGRPIAATTALSPPVSPRSMAWTGVGTGVAGEPPAVKSEITEDSARSLGDKTARSIKEALASLPSDVARAVSGALSNQGIHINLDGKEIANAVTKTLPGPRRSSPPDGPTNFNLRDSPTYPGLSVPY